MAFQLIAGHPALDFVNTLDWRFRKEGTEELLNTYGDLLRLTEQSKLLTWKQARELGRFGNDETMVCCRELREALADTFYGRGPSVQSRKTLEKYFRAALLERKLSWKQSPHVEWSWSSVRAHLAGEDDGLATGPP